MTGLQQVTAAFSQAESEDRAALVCYLTPGYPDRDTFMRDARAVLEHADILEVGIPFSDPLGDGPVIQAASQKVLETGQTVSDVFGMIGELTKLGKPVLAMTYYNPVISHPGGERGFLEALKAVGGAGVILPDLPPDEAAGLRAAAEELGLAAVFLVAPTSTAERLELVGRNSSGFVYVVSVTGVTGTRSSVSADVPGLVQRLAQVTELPAAVGFGVSSPETARTVAAAADGVVVGSALISRQGAGQELGPFVASLKEACYRS